MQWLMPYVGFDFRYRKTAHQEKTLFGQSDTKNDRKVVCIGVQYTLPMLFVLDGRIDSRGKLRLQVGREDIPITARLRMNLMFNSDREYIAGLRYVVTRYFSFSTHYDSDMGFGAGITLNY